MSRFRFLLTLLVCAVLGAAAIGLSQSPAVGEPQRRRGASVPIDPSDECPPGTTLARPGRCQAPGIPPPSIVDYRPTSTLVTSEHLVPKAKFPVIDFHGHPQGRFDTPEALATLMGELDSLNVRLMVSADNMSGDRLERSLASVSASPYATRTSILCGINFQNVGPGWAEKAIAQLDADVAAGAVGVGEISKGFGLNTRKADGTRLMIDDPAIGPIWEEAGRLDIPVFIHTADPQEFFEPIDNHNERWLELALFPNRRYPDGQFPRFNELMAERDRMIAAHPNTTFVIAHLSWYGNDLDRLAMLLDEHPNAFTELGAVLYDLGRQPRAARDFLVKYQDRVLFGKDAYEPTEYPYYWRVLETTDEYFDYYRDYHAFWKLYGLDLPDDVLKKLYYQNALAVAPRIPKDGFPE